MNRELEDILHRLGLRLGGSKTERMGRIVNHFVGNVSTQATTSAPGNAVDDERPRAPAPSPDMLAAQELFRQKASNPQASLQPWLEQILDATGVVRCYATEDANPTKQLKNKLSQAAAARGGLLVLLLADEAAFSKAREALADRWMMNDEWPKSIACVALGYPLAAPTIQAIIECTESPWPTRIRNRLFGSAKVFRAKSGDGERASMPPAGQRCTQCGYGLPEAARFCPYCGARTA
jgi:hypothetical protein